MAEALDLAATIAGGLTALGVVLDWGVAPETKQKIQTKLEGLLYRFRYTTLRTFGRAEIEFSMRVFDLFGKRFFSWRRLIFVVIVYALLVAIVTLVATQLRPGPVSYGPMRLFDFHAMGWVLLTFSIVNTVLFALSISITMWLSNLLLRLPGGVTPVATIGLLILHLALLFVWQPFVAGIVAIFMVLPWVEYDFKRSISFVQPTVLEYALDPLKSFDAIKAFWARTDVQEWIPILNIVDSLLSLFANALRMGLALLFILGFLYVRTVRPALIWFWSGLTRSQALFSPPLSAAAAIILAIAKRDAIIGALSRPFQ